jgi:hypothetical protein
MTVLKFAWERSDIYVYIYIYTEFWWQNLKQRGRLKDIGIIGRIILKFILKNQEMGGVWIRFIWLRILISDKQLCTLIFRFYKMQEISQPTENPLLLKKGYASRKW